MTVVAEKTMLDALEKFDADHNTVVINGAVYNVLNSLLLLVLDDESGF